MTPSPVSEAYKPSRTHRRIIDEPATGNYDIWGYSIGYEVMMGGANVPKNGNTAIFRIQPGGMTEPVLVTKLEEHAKFKVRTLQGHGKLIRTSNDNRVEVRDLSPGDAYDTIIRPGDAYSYVNTSRLWDLILHDVAKPAFVAGDEVKLTSSLVPGELPVMAKGFDYCLVETAQSKSLNLELPSEFYELIGRAAARRP